MRRFEPVLIVSALAQVALYTRVAGGEVMLIARMEWGGQC